MGHAKLVLRALEELTRREILNDILMLVHSRNNDKTPEAPIDVRTRWLPKTLSRFAPEATGRVRICTWGAEKDQPYIYDLIEEFQQRLLRIAGSDKKDKINQGSIRTLIVPRNTDESSTRVKELMRQTGSHPELRAAMDHSVLEEALSMGLYRGRVNLEI